MYQYHYQRPTPHLLFDIAKGKMYDSEAVNIFGFNRDVNGSFETVWNDGDAYVYPTSALTMTIVSSSASDTMSVLVSGLDANYDQISETVTLTGTVAVTLSTQFYRINSAVILAGNNAGNITISNGGVTYAFIEAGTGATQACLFTVPNGYDLYLFRITANSATATGSQYLTIRNALRTSTGRELKVAEATFAESQVNYDRQIPFKIAEKTDFQFEAKSSASTNQIAIFVEAVLVKQHEGQ
jgi:hypothetical protein